MSSEKNALRANNDVFLLEPPLQRSSVGAPPAGFSADALLRRQLILLVGMAGRYTGSYLDQSNGWRAAAILADIGQASLDRRIPTLMRYDFAGRVTNISSPMCAN